MISRLTRQENDQNCSYGTRPLCSWATRLALCPLGFRKMINSVSAANQQGYGVWEWDKNMEFWTAHSSNLISDQLTIIVVMLDIYYVMYNIHIILVLV